MARSLHYSGRRRARTGVSVPLLVTAAVALLLAVTTVFAARDEASEPILGAEGSSILLAWTTGGIDPGFASTASQLPGVNALAEVRNGMGWLTAWSAEGATPSSPPDGFQVPMEIAAVDPAEYANFVPTQQRELFAQLAQGGALLGKTGAELRGIVDRGSLQFGEVTIPVLGVVEDDLLASHEAVMSNQTAAALGVEDPKYVLIAPEDGEEVSEALRRQAPSGKEVGTRRVDEAAILRPGGTILPQAQMKKGLGEFAARPGKGAALIIDPAWIEANTSNATIPLLGVVRCHNKIIPAMEGAFNEVVEKELTALVRNNDFGGCLAPRNLSSDPHSGISRHAWGAAFDFNVSTNLLGDPPTMDPRLVEIMQSWGFAWGGRWLVPDGMHFEYLEEPQ